MKAVKRNDNRMGTFSLAAICCVIYASIASFDVLPSAEARPSYAECQSTSECKPGFCCVLKMDRYSVPSCQPMKSKGETCRLGSEAFDVQLGYPNGDSLNLTNVYRIFCGCGDGLYCKSSSRTCEPKPGSY